MPRSQTYCCECSKCHGKRIFRTQRTIETHLSADQSFLQSLPQDGADLTGNRAFVESCITRTIHALSTTHGGHLLPHTAPEAVGSGSDRSEGAQLRFFES